MRTAIITSESPDAVSDAIVRRSHDFGEPDDAKFHVTTANEGRTRMYSVLLIWYERTISEEEAGAELVKALEHSSRRIDAAVRAAHEKADELTAAGRTNISAEDVTKLVVTALEASARHGS